MRQPTTAWHKLHLKIKRDVRWIKLLFEKRIAWRGNRYGVSRRGPRQVLLVFRTLCSENGCTPERLATSTLKGQLFPEYWGWLLGISHRGVGHAWGKHKGTTWACKMLTLNDVWTESSQGYDPHDVTHRFLDCQFWIGLHVISKSCDLPEYC